MATVSSRLVRIPSALGLAGLLTIAVAISAPGVGTVSGSVRAAQVAVTAPVATQPAASAVTVGSAIAIEVSGFPADATIRVYGGVPVIGAAYRSLGEGRTDSSGTARLQLDASALEPAEGPLSVVVATPDFRYRATANVGSPSAPQGTSR